MPQQGQQGTDSIAGMKVLVVDDTAANRQVLQVLLGRFGCKVVLAEDGARAVELFSAESFDLVLMDVMMPVMDGYEATRRIKAASQDRWVPVIFVSALGKDENLVAGLDAGGDDYLAKPINFVVLQAKLRSIARTLRMQDSLREHSARLQRYRDEREAENALAGGIMERLMQRDGLCDVSVRHWLMPASGFSGDAIATARSPEGRLYGMLADATGHGLAAAISSVPVLTTFYSLVDHGYPLGFMAYEINRQLMTFLPSGHFVAASLVCVDTVGHSVEVWAGGMPAPLLVGPEGALIRRFPSNHPPMGIVEFDEDMIGVERFDCLPDSQLVLYSDGLTEAEGQEGGEAFGEERLLETLGRVAHADRIGEVAAAFSAHIGGRAPHDDVSLLLMDC